jgi:hypothetical protein
LIQELIVMKSFAKCLLIGIEIGLFCTSVLGILLSPIFYVIYRRINYASRTH